MSDTFCILPWMHQATNARAICEYVATAIGKNFILKEDNTSHKLHKDDLEEVKRTVYKKIREQMLNGECPKCVLDVSGRCRIKKC